MRLGVSNGAARAVRAQTDLSVLGQLLEEALVGRVARLHYRLFEPRLAHFGGPITVGRGEPYLNGLAQREGRGGADVLLRLPSL